MLRGLLGRLIRVKVRNFVARRKTVDKTLIIEIIEWRKLPSRIRYHVFLYSVNLRVGDVALDTTLVEEVRDLPDPVGYGSEGQIAFRTCRISWPRSLGLRSSPLPSSNRSSNSVTYLSLHHTARC
jgi:hypothetical protein